MMKTALCFFAMAFSLSFGVSDGATGSFAFRHGGSYNVDYTPTVDELPTMKTKMNVGFADGHAAPVSGLEVYSTPQQPYGNPTADMWFLQQGFNVWNGIYFDGTY